jgi:hypothetical protein
MPFSGNSADCLVNYGLPSLRGKLIGASLESYFGLNALTTMN